MLEVLAPHAAAAFQSARLLEAERGAAQAAGALLQLSQALTARHTLGDIFRDAIETIPTIIPCVASAAYVRDEATGDFRLRAAARLAPATAYAARADIADMPGGARRSTSCRATRTLRRAARGRRRGPRRVPAAGQLRRRPGRVRCGGSPSSSGALVAIGAPGAEPVRRRGVRLARGVGDLTALALGNAPADQRARAVPPAGGESGRDLLGGRRRRPRPHIPRRPARRPVRRRRGAVGMDASGATTSRTRTARSPLRRFGARSRREPMSASSTGSARRRATSLWLRDLVHVVHGRQGTRQIRGLIIDITERKQAEQALRESERKYSEAFLREREAAQQLRALDDMKNTFLEAVSHDLRTPLTSILGSALTLEQSRLEMPPSRCPRPRSPDRRQRAQARAAARRSPRPGSSPARHRDAAAPPDRRGCPDRALSSQRSRTPTRG